MPHEMDHETPGGGPPGPGEPEPVPADAARTEEQADGTGSTQEAGAGEAQVAGAGEAADTGGTAEPAPDPEPTDPEGANPAAAAGGAEGGAAGGGAARRALRVPALLGLATVLLGGFGVWASVAAHDLRGSEAGQNVALTDAAATGAVKRQVTSAVNTIFSYSYTDTAATRRSAQRLLTGQAIRQYDQLFSVVQKDAPAQKLVVTTRVTNAGVEFLSGGRARVLVFANQQDSRAGTKQASYAGTMFAVTAVRAGGTWKIENIDTFTGG